MSSTTQFFDENVVARIEALYTNRDTVDKHALALEALDPRAGEQHVDIGCGPGFLTQRIAQEVGPTGSVLAPDNNEMMLELAHLRLELNPNVIVKHADATALTASDEAYDAAICRQVLEYVPDVERAIAEIYRVLKPGRKSRYRLSRLGFDCLE